MARLDRIAARDILQRCKVPLGADFHTLGSAQVEALLEEARAYGYRQSPNAPGSKGRMFCQFVQRVATREA